MDASPATATSLSKQEDYESSSYVNSLDSIVFTFEKSQPSVFTVYQKNILGAYLSMVSLYG
jgi:hypothetical protein